MGQRLGSSDSYGRRGGHSTVSILDSLKEGVQLVMANASKKLQEVAT